MKEKKVSKEEQEEQTIDSVFDFIYFDTDKVGSFLSQFNKSGHLKEVIQRENVSQGNKRGFKIGLGGGASLLGTGGSGNLNLELPSNQTGSEGSDRIYDPFWGNALYFLDICDEMGFITHQPMVANIGQIVLTTGNLSILDMQLIQNMWEIPLVKKVIKEGMQGSQPQPILTRSQLKSGAKKDSLQDSNQMADLMITMIKSFPHSLICSLFSSGQYYWSGLNAKYLSGRPEDLVIKHGCNIPGTWNMIGILDAKPDENEMEHTASDGLGLVGGFGAAIAPIVRQAVGRPPNAFGLTPLVIFRKVCRV